MDKELLGKVFISHCSADKIFVRKLAADIELAGFGVWLDEKHLSPGNYLAKEISEGIRDARVVIVVVSASSVSSKWLRYELNIATVRMVEGKCKVLPVVIEKVDVPPEVSGILYVDFTEEYDASVRRILEACDNEAMSHPLNRDFESGMLFLTESFLGQLVRISVTGKGRVFRHDEYMAVQFREPSDDDEDDEGRDIPIKIVEKKSHKKDVLDEHWLQQYANESIRRNENIFLVFTEIPISFSRRKKISGADDLIASFRLPRTDLSSGGGSSSAYAVFVDFSGEVKNERKISVFQSLVRVLDAMDGYLPAQW